ncbi:MAG: HIT family protein [Candidatus Aenigmatarchaeota archaeon]
MECIFCDIVNGKAPCHKIWEDDKHLAILSIFPNTGGFTVVITKKHYSSYAFDVPENVFLDLMTASRKVGRLLDKKLGDVGRTGLIAEGFGINHLHTKLFPMHGTKAEKWKAVNSKVDKYFEKYEGYISSHNGKRADDKKLAELAKKIRK